MFTFATCDPKRAFLFIKKFHNVEEDDISDLLKLIKSDIARVLDPNFHSPCQIILGKKGRDEDIEKIKLACEPLRKV